MRLKRLEIQGFKSFLDRTIISFDKDITGVVGPNGCGKSNIVDAIQWVMGEQSAKHLRGDSMSDVIFNGSDAQAPTSMAEVTLVMDKMGMNLPTALAGLDRGEEVAVTRRLYRDGTAEYMVNKTICRLKDIHELFMDTGVGRRAYSIIEQGQIDRMVNVKPEDRRTIFEEVAGITKYRAKRKEAERKIAQTQLNLSRLQDIITELDKRMRSLKIQASRARKYKEIKVEVENIDLFLLGRRLYDLKKKINEHEQQKIELDKRRSELDASFASMDAELTQQEVLRLDLEKKAEALDQQERNLTYSIQKLESQSAILLEQRKHLIEANTAQEQETLSLRMNLEATLSETTHQQDQVQDFRSSLDRLETEIHQAEKQATQAEADKEASEDREQELQSILSDLAQKAVYLSNQKTHSEAKHAELLTQRESLNQQLSELVAVISEKKDAIEKNDQKIEERKAQTTEVGGMLNEVESECQSISDTLTEIENRIFKKREEYHVTHSRLQSLKELQENLEGYSPTAREILLKLEDPSLKAVPLGELLTPASDMETALEFLLGDAIHTLIVEESETAARLANLVESRDLEKVGILSREEISAATETRSVPNCKLLLSDIQVAPENLKIAHHWLGNVWVCQSSPELFTLRNQYPDLTFVSADGRTVAFNNRLIQCGKMPNKSGIFERRREIEVLNSESIRLAEELSALDKEQQDTLARLEEKENLQQEYKEKLSVIHIQTVELRKESERLQSEAQRIDTDYNRVIADSDKNQTTLHQIKKQLETLALETERVQSERQTAESQKAELLVESESFAAQLEEMAELISAKKIERSEKQARLQSAKDRLEQLTQEKNRQEEKLLSIESKKSENEKRIQDLVHLEAETQKDLQNLETDRGRVSVELSDVRIAHKELTDKLVALRETKEKSRSERDEIVSQSQEVELALAAEKTNYSHQQNLSVERHQKEAAPLDERARIELKDLPLFSTTVRIDWATLPHTEKEALLSEHLDSLRKKAERYGEVNLTAINEYDEVEERHKFLTTQKEDLEKSIAILEEAIQKIDTTTVDRFNSTVEGVNEKFQEVFPILFNGGKARLALTSPENLLESGVDIMVQPPGKRLQSISLLSGGEKALTAVSLILAIFARKPSPFCLLDEVDAPLDDANVSRFNTVIKHMSRKSQFILVTHNRRTMEVADSLYGVTMERSGISKLTSVQLS